MKVNEFLNEVLAAAKAAGIDPAEVYYHGGDSFNVSALDGEISDYKVASSCGVSLRGMFGGKMGSASTEAFDDDAVRQLIDGVKESATLLETDEQDEIFAGEERYPTIEKEESDVATTSAEAKIEKCLKLEALAKAADPRIVRVPSAMVASSSSEVILRNSYGLNLQDSGSYFFSYTSLVAKDGTSTAVNGKVAVSSRFDGIDPEKIAADAAKETLSQLNASPVPTGEYRVIFRYDAMQSLLQTFWGVFSAENAQQNLSLFAGKEGENVAADVVTIGSHVRVLDVDEDAEEEYTIVGSQEANPMEGCISDDSPFGFALKGHKVGETVTVTAPVGELQFKIIAVENED